jgi:hypothetical protein
MFVSFQTPESLCGFSHSCRRRPQRHDLQGLGDVFPSLVNRAPPQQAHADGPAIITRSRGRCSGMGLRAGRLRVNDVTVVVLAAAISGASSSSVAKAYNSSTCSSS